MTLADAVNDVAAALVAAGIPASADPQNLTPPGVWVQLDTIAHPYLSGHVTARLKLAVIVGDAGTDHALTALSDLYARCVDVVTPNTDVDTRTLGVYLPDNPTTPLPALQYTVDVPAALT